MNRSTIFSLIRTWFTSAHKLQISDKFTKSSTTMNLQTLVWIAVGLVAMSFTFQTSSANSDPDKLTKMAETLKMLHNLDKYYSQIARPSPRSTGLVGSRELSKVADAIRMIQLHELDRNYIHRTRPRFGKRAEFPLYQERLDDELVDEMPDKKLWDRLVR